VTGRLSARVEDDRFRGHLDPRGKDGAAVADVRGETGGEAAEAQVREAMPGALVARREREKAGVRPGIGKVAGTPGRLEAKTDLAGRVVLAQQKPLPASFQVPIERVDGDGAKGACPVGVCAGCDDPRRAEVAQPQDVNLQQE